MQFIKSHILFVIFIIMSGSLLLAQQTFGILTAIRFSNSYNESEFSESVLGEIYKASWNRENDFVLNCGEYKILVRGSRLSEDCIVKMNSAEYIVVKALPEIPSECRNFGEFDMQKYLAAKDIDYILYPSDDSIEIRNDMSLYYTHSIQYYSSLVRKYIKNILIRNSDIDTASVSMSIMTGDSALLTNETKSAFQKAGLSHLMAVSGAHVAYIVNPIKKLLKLFRARWFGIKYKNLMLAPFVLLLLFISGFSPSILRASVMYICLIFSVVFCRKYDPLNSLGFAGILLLLINHCYVFDVGFILSFGACICLYTVLPALKSIKVLSVLPCKKIKDGLLSGIAVSLGITPVTMNMFNGFSPAGILVNLIASPLAQIICTGSYILTLTASLGFPYIVTSSLSYALTSIVFFLEKCAVDSKEGFFGYSTCASIPVLHLIIYYSFLFFIVICMQRKIKFRRAGILAVAGVISVAAIRFIPPEVELLFFDVGQGVSILLKTGDGYCGLVDTGDGNTDISSLLRKESVKKLDFIVLSHGHSDHSGGFKNILSNYECDIVFLPTNEHDTSCEEYSQYAAEQNTAVKYIDSETVVQIGKYTSMRLFCNTDNENINDSSVIAVFEGDWGSVVLPGDIENKGEISFSEIYKKDVDLICVPHHGSNSSSCDEFLKTLQPEYAIISVGENNMYGHPSYDVIGRLNNFTSGGIYRTDICGAVRVRFGTLFDIFGEDVKVWQKKKLSE